MWPQLGYALESMPSAFPLHLQLHFSYITQVVLRADVRGQRGGGCCVGRQHEEHRLVPHPTPNLSTAFLYQFDTHVRYYEDNSNVDHDSSLTRARHYYLNATSNRCSRGAAHLCTHCRSPQPVLQVVRRIPRLLWFRVPVHHCAQASASRPPHPSRAAERARACQTHEHCATTMH